MYSLTRQHFKAVLLVLRQVERGSLNKLHCYTILCIEFYLLPLRKGLNKTWMSNDKNQFLVMKPFQIQQ